LKICKKEMSGHKSKYNLYIKGGRGEQKIS
jgi:hypothetical protein